MTTDNVGASGRAVAADAAEPVVSALRASIPDATDLLATIRKTVRGWAGAYERECGHRVDGAYLAGLANDVAFHLGILEAAQAIEARRAETGTGSVHESAVPQGCAQTPSGDNA